VRETVNVLKDVSRALIFAHERAIIHRDIKPDNVLLSTGAGAAVVTDFGVAKALTDARTTTAPLRPGMTGAGMTIGTPAYMAPEQAAADPNVDHRVDLYALGILGYEMLAGSPPFHGRSPHELLAAQMTEIPAPLHIRRYDVPKALNDLLMMCLEKTPAVRPRSASALLKALEQPEVTSGIFAAPSSHRMKDWKTFAGFAAAVAVLVFAVDMARSRFGPQAQQAPVINLAPVDTSISLAVLPLRVLGADARAAAIGDAVSAEVATAITDLPRLRVASSASIDALGDSTRSLAATARLLGVSHLLEGTIQRERGRVRATLRLVRAASDSSVWGDTFTGSTDSTFDFQTRIARGVRDALSRR
jgi:serine/threonine-protein kinase